MATAAKTKINSECAICFDEQGSYTCIRPAHTAYKGQETPITKELLATAIVGISDAVKALYKTGLNKRAVVALIADDTKLGKKTIETVLDSIADLQKNYAK